MHAEGVWRGGHAVIRPRGVEWRRSVIHRCPPRQCSWRQHRQRHSMSCNQRSGPMARRNPVESVSGEPMGSTWTYAWIAPTSRAYLHRGPCRSMSSSRSPGLSRWVALLDRCFPNQGASTGSGRSTVEDPSSCLRHLRPTLRFIGSDRVLLWTAGRAQLGRVHWVGAEDAHRGRTSDW